MEEHPTTAPVEKPAEAPAGTETNTTNSAPAGQSQEITAEQVAKFFGTDADTINKVQKFSSGNGGFAKTFEERKIERTTRQADTATPVQDKVQSQPEPQKAEETTPTMAEGYVSPREIEASIYFNNLANNKEYASIADEIRTGEIFKGMAKLGIKTTDANGNFNDAQIREYLNLRAATATAKQEADVASKGSSAPTVDYVGLNDGKVTNMDQAIAIINQSRELEAKGLAGNPNKEAAMEFMKGIFNKK